MFKLNSLINKIEKFYNLSKLAQQQGWHMPDDDDEDNPSWTAQPTDNSLLDKADRYDIANQALFDQFENFVDTYREIIADLGMNPKALDPDTFDDVAQKSISLRTRADRIINNPYLNKKVTDDDWEENEDFDPVEFTKLIMDMLVDVDNRMKNIAGEDVSADEIRSAQYAREFNAIQEDHVGTKEDKYSAERIAAARLARKNWYTNFMKNVAAKIPEAVARYTAILDSRRKYYRQQMDILQDPKNKTEYDKYLKKLKERQVKFVNKLSTREKEIEAKLQITTNPTTRKELEEELTKIRGQITKRKINQQKHNVGRTVLKQSGTLAGYNKYYSDALASVKSDTLKLVVSKLESEDPFYTPYKNKIADAVRIGDKNALNQAKLELITIMKNRINDTKKHAAQDPIMQTLVNEIKIPYALRDQIKSFDDSGMLDKLSASDMPENAKGIILDGVRDILKTGLSVVSTYKDKKYTINGTSTSYKGAIDRLIITLKFLKDYLPAPTPQG